MSRLSQVARASVVAGFLAATLSARAQIPLTGEIRVNTYTSFDQRRPRIAADSNGGFVILWDSQNQDGSSNGVYAQRFDRSVAPFGPELAVNGFTTNLQRRPSVATIPNGTFVAAWESTAQDGGSAGVFSRRFDFAGFPYGSEFKVNTFTTGPQFYSAIASDTAGGFLVAWGSVSQDGSQGGIFGQRFSSNGSSLGPEFSINTYTTVDQGFPNLAMNAAGDFVVVWASSPGGAGNPSQDGDLGGIFGQRFTSSGAKAGGEFRVNSTTTFYQIFPDVAADPAGNFVVVWTSLYLDGNYSGIFGQRYTSAGAPLGDEFRVNDATTDAQDRARVASDAAGNFVVVWETSSASNNDVFGRRFASTGAPLGGDFQANTYTTVALLNYPAIACDSAGNFVVTWDRMSMSATSFDIFARRYCPPLSTVAAGVASGSTQFCPGGTGGTAAVIDTGGATVTHQWGYRTVSGGMTISPIPGETGKMYVMKAGDFPGNGTFYLVCTTTPSCCPTPPSCGGSAMTSNEITVMIGDGAPPVVTPAAASTVTQSLCQ